MSRHVLCPGGSALPVPPKPQIQTLSGLCQHLREESRRTTRKTETQASISKPLPRTPANPGCEGLPKLSPGLTQSLDQVHP